MWGEQGASNALAVAQQLGFDRSVLADAKQWAARLAAQGKESVKKGESMQEEMMVRLVDFCFCRGSRNECPGLSGCMFNNPIAKS